MYIISQTLMKVSREQLNLSYFTGKMVPLTPTELAMMQFSKGFVDED